MVVKIIDISETLEKVNPEEVAKALGAEQMTPKEAAEFLRKTQQDNTTEAKDYSKLNDLITEVGEPYVTHRHPEIF